MKTLYKNTLTPLWAKIFIYSITLICSLIAFNGGIYYGIGALVIFNAIPVLSFKLLENKEKWKNECLQKDSFFTNENYTSGSGGIYSIIALSKDKLCVVNVKGTILIGKRNYNIVEIYPNYPSKDWKEVTLLGVPANYIEIPTEHISSVHPINQGEAGWKYLAKKMNFGIRLTMKNKEIIDVDTIFSNEFCQEINSYLSAG